MEWLFHILLTVMEVSISTGVVILILLLTAPFFNKRYTSKWRYYIWIGLAVRLMIPVNFSLPAIRMEIAVPAAQTVTATETAGDGIPVMLPTGQPEQRGSWFSVPDIVTVIWFTVFVCIVAVHIYSSLHYKRRIMKNGTYVEEEPVLRQLSVLKRELKINRKITVTTYCGLASPMVIGYFSPLLVIPDNVYSEQELFYILKHELIHMKRHDTLVQFLFMTARALHWFNPLIALMQKEAVVDMELSCDEEVIKGNSYGERKAYTETLLSTVNKQYKRTNLLTTQFYGGKRVMKKRFQNILAQSKRRKGFFLLPTVLCMTLALGMLTGCAVTEPETLKDAEVLTEREREVSPREVLPGEASGMEETGKEQESEQQSEAVAEQTQDQNGLGGQQLQEGSQPEDNQKPGERLPLSEDAMELIDVAGPFSTAYFAGDKEEMRKYLADSFEGDIDVYSDADTQLTGMTALKGLEDIGEAKIGDTYPLSMDCQMTGMGEGFCYLTMEVEKQEDGWKIVFYGLER